MESFKNFYKIIKLNFRKLLNTCLTNGIPWLREIRTNLRKWFFGKLSEQNYKKSARYLGPYF